MAEGGGLLRLLPSFVEHASVRRVYHRTDIENPPEIISVIGCLSFGMARAGGHHHTGTHRTNE